jgi:histidinol-phosphate/aromatic aminotransferase/cobyric acid decarboxylase-like protein
MRVLAESRAVPPRVHGGTCEEEFAALGIRRESIVDFSTCLNPYGPSQAVVDAVRAAPLDRYPDPTARAVRRRLAETLDVEPDALVFGNGAADLLWTIARVLLGPGDTVVIVEPTFSEFRAAAGVVGARVVELRFGPLDRFQIDLARVTKVIRTVRPRVVSLCVPNNPTGVVVPAAEIAALAAGHPDVGIVLDQAFLPLSEAFDDLAARFPPNVLCVRSLTKDHAIPGVRAGYLLCVRDLAARVEAARPAWTTSTMAQAAALATCSARAFVEETRPRVLGDREHVQAVVRRRGLRPLPSATPFFLVPVPNAGDLRRRLLVRHRVLVRDCASFGLPGFIRLSARPRAEVAHLDAALAEEVSAC